MKLKSTARSGHLDTSVMPQFNRQQLQLKSSATPATVVLFADVGGGLRHVIVDPPPSGRGGPSNHAGEICTGAGYDLTSALNAELRAEDAPGCMQARQQVLAIRTATNTLRLEHAEWLVLCVDASAVAHEHRETAAVHALLEDLRLCN
eukprot:CAMPEP_0115212160 /NCGR_PEP_ID=MMETSP0270-20121206/23134_1 /TAXON_ID=71861 /ORGANISM="Scrippsiella trochoidea, Strain CCMP3099" /LENGTH=147 /DNA_ID=CAMNT_0002625867 /DNA_START=358 /DNA_END=797 /DNA_ORIENTATION=+